MTKIQNRKKKICFGHLNIGDLELFRISIFEFRIWVPLIDLVTRLLIKWRRRGSYEVEIA